MRRRDRSYDAVLFDMDGVLASTTALHAACWKETFDAVLAEWGQPPFDIKREYAAHVDGKPRADGVRDFLRARGAAGVRTAVVSSSTNADKVLTAAGLDASLDATVDGSEAERLGLRGRPAPDSFLEAAQRLGVPAARAVVVEDALAGVAAGRAGGFGLVMGVARNVGRAALQSAGAHVIVDDLGEMVQ